MTITLINLKTIEKINLIDKINNGVKSIMTEKITDQMHKALESVFQNRKNKDNWKNSIDPIQFTLTLDNYERIIKSVGLLAMSYTHFHGGYELIRIGLTDTIEISSKGYYHYMEA